MSRRFKIIDPPPVGLCRNCRCAQIIESENDIMVVCNEPVRPLRIMKPVVRCNTFAHANQPMKYEMDKIAWNITISEAAGKRVVGFEPPKEDK